MAITSNKNTTQSPMSATGLTGVQVLKFIDAPRVYLKSADSLSAATIPTAKSNGATPSGWIDLGIVEGTCKIGVEKKVKEVKTGIDNYFRAAYTNEKVGTCEFSLSQLDDVAFGQVTGLTASVVNSGSTYSYAVGSEDLSQQAILMVVQNKLDGKEWQFYNPNAYLNFSIEDSGDEFRLKVTGLLPFFLAPGQASEQMLAQTLFR